MTTTRRLSAIKTPKKGTKVITKEVFYAFLGFLGALVVKSSGTRSRSMKKILLLFMLALSIWAGSAVVAWSQSPSAEDEAFLELVEHKAFDFFWMEANPANGLIPDGTHQGSGCSIASVGWGLSAICVAESRHWITHQQAYDRVLTTLNSFVSPEGKPDSALVEGRFGLFFHFVNMSNGRWMEHWDCVSTADTAMLMAGVITCMEYFKGTEIERVADRIFRDCQWDQFMQDNNHQPQEHIAMGYVPPDQPSTWTREKGFFGRYAGYQDNSFMIYIMALASPTHPVPAAAWYACQNTYQWEDYQGEKILATSPPGLAFHYYPHTWLDLRYQKDQVADYFENTRKAVRAQQAYCEQTAGYPDGLWGLSSSQSDKGYEAFGAPLAGTLDRGILTPHAIAGGMVFNPEKSLEALKKIYDTRKTQTWGVYGFTDAFSVRSSWSSPTVLGLDEGPIVLMIENYRTNLIWKTFSSNRYIRGALRKIGFVGVIEDFKKDPGASGYSRYSLKSGRASLRIDRAGSMEGQGCLRVQPEKSGPVMLVFQPKLHDFSPYHSLAVWSRNVKAMQVILRDRQGGEATLEPDAVVQSGAWQRNYFPLAGLVKIHREDIAEVSLRVNPDAGPQDNGFRLDDLCLTYEQATQVPMPPTGLRVSTPKDNALVKVVFQQAAGVIRYDIRYSGNPVRSEKDFENLAVLDPQFAAPRQPEKEIYLVMPSKGRYYIAVQGMDPQGMRSKVVSAGPVTVAGTEARETLADFQTQGLVTDRHTWRGSGEGIRLEISPKSAAPGLRALAVRYQKAGAWDFVELNFTASLDVSPYRFLKIRVYGKERLIAKLYNSETRQADIAEIESPRENQWNELRFDMSAMRSLEIDKKHVQKILIFMAPGQVTTGEFYIDKVWLSGE
jgi:hypothetical protein